EVLRRAEVNARLDAVGLLHAGVHFGFSGRAARIDLRERSGKGVTVYGPTELTKDLVSARAAAHGTLLFGAAGGAIEDIDGEAPRLRYTHDGTEHTLRCDFVAGCDGYHGVSRRTFPPGVLRTYERVYPFGWLGILADAKPVLDELIYASHERGFAL